MLQLKPNCECCDRDLSASEAGAFICSFECTFCADCSENKLSFVCPNCGGPLVARPTRSSELLQKYPASTTRVVSDSCHSQHQER